MALKLRVVPREKLYVSTPNPLSFGNVPDPPVADPNWSEDNWLTSRFHFSFAEYDNPDNVRFGAIRVINDDIVQPDRGFGTHPHQDMEILTYVVSGQLTHEDSMGNVESLGRGSVQFMTAGTGVEHSEYNHSTDTPFRCIQTWILPSAYDLKPRYGSYVPSGGVRKNELVHVASNVETESSPAAPIQIYQDVDCYVAELEQDAEVALEISEGRQAYLVCIEGSLRLEHSALATTDNDNFSGAATVVRKYDGCEVTAASGGGNLTMTAVATEETEHGTLAHAIVFLMAANAAYGGRKDL